MISNTSTLPNIGRRMFAAGIAAVGLWTGTASAEYYVSAYRDTAGFDEIMMAEYSAARDAIETRSTVHEPGYARSTNACVAGLMTDDLDAALTSCNQALRETRRDASSAFTFRKGRNTTRAAILNNRGVVLASQGLTQEAEADFTRALALDPGNGNAGRNLDDLRNRQVGVR